MCGICGFYSTNEVFSRIDLENMTSALKHRGPDAQGLFYDQSVGLGHTRLSILDLSNEANQPMVSSNQRYIIVYNGEVYNFNEIKKKLSIKSKTNSDTEVILEAFVKLGVNAIQLFNGMFAFAILDKSTNQLFLCRDRMGIKPLFYFYDGKNFAFASEIKSLLKSKYITNHIEINKEVIPYFLHLGFIPEPFTIYKNIYKFPSSHYAIINKNNFTLKNYWNIENSLLDIAYDDFNFVKNKLKELIIDSVSHQLISDVPLGVFLSGGVDSSLIAAIAQSLKQDRIKTFSIGFTESKYNESHYAKDIANYLKTDHYEFIVTYKDAIEKIDEILNTYDEPFADASSVPTMLVSMLARKNIKVVLSGDGADELFLGYGSYRWAHRLSHPFIKSLRYPIYKFLSILGNREKRAAHLFKYNDENTIKSHIFSQEQYYFSQDEINDLLLTNNQYPITLNETIKTNRLLNPIEQQSIFDLRYYLKDDLLVKIDRVSMKYGLETRVPYLDHKIIELAININSNLKLKNGQGKFILKEILYEYIPQHFFNRPKWGFALPIKLWLKKELYYLVEKYLSQSITKEINIFKYEKIQDLKVRFLKGEDYLYNRIWLVILLHKFMNNENIRKHS